MPGPLKRRGASPWLRSKALPPSVNLISGGRQATWKSQAEPANCVWPGARQADSRSRLVVGRRCSLASGTSGVSAIAPLPKLSERQAQSALGTPRGEARSPRRADIQGLRAVLMLQVLLFHAWAVGSPIGVDAFILVSAFLMTSSFVRRSEAGRMPFFVERWGNTFKRLLPPLVVVVLATLAGTFFFLPATRWKETTVQAFASITYWENWRLVEVAADYYADDHGLSSPLQHLWSMSMQGQVFLLWPLLMTLCVLLARRLKVGVRPVVMITFGALAVLSLVWLIGFAPEDGSVYFDTRARIWEFAFGSMVAAAAPWLKLPKRVAAVASGLAFATLLVFCLVPIGSYPGPMAIFPMASTSVLMLYGPTTKGMGVEKLLSWRPLTSLGDISYAVYLVHWPIFVFYLAQKGEGGFSPLEGIALIAASVTLAWILTKTVDDPLRKLPWANASTARKYVVIVASLAAGLTPIAAVYTWIESRTAGNASALAPQSGDLTSTEYYTAIPESGPGSPQFPGARVLVDKDVTYLFEESPIPDPLQDSLYSRWENECSEDFNTSIETSEEAWCTAHGDPDTSEARVLVAGSSHAEQLLVAQIVPLMNANNWSGYAVLRGNCPWTMPGADILDDREQVQEDCNRVNTALLQQLDEYQPDYTFLVVTQTDSHTNEEVVFPGILELVQEMTSRGIEVIGVRDNLRADFDLRECSTDRPADRPYGGCLLSEAEYFPSEDPTVELGDFPGFHLVEYRDLYCVDGVCPTIIGNIVTYFDSNHISGEYAISMAPFFSQRVAEALGLPH